MGFMIFIAVAFLGAAWAYHRWDWIKAQFKAETYEPTTTTKAIQRRQAQARERALLDPISVDEFFTFRWNVHRCPDVVLRQEMEGGAQCDFCGDTGVGSS